MLVQFTVENYRSIKDVVTFTMLADKKDTKNLFAQRNSNLLTSAVFYGANASGKSNMLRAFSFMKNIVLNTTKVMQSIDTLPYEPFRLSTETEKEPSSFEVVFFVNNIKYRYGFELNSTTIFAEWLFADEKGREAKLFYRDIQENEFFINSEKFKEGKNLKVLENSLFLWKCDQDGGIISNSIMQWFSNLNLIDGTNDSGYVNFALRKMNEEDFKTKIVNLVSSVDLGIADILIEKDDIVIDNADKLDLPTHVKNLLPEGKGTLIATTITTQHKKYDANNTAIGIEDFNLILDESQGTKKYFSISAPILDTLTNGKILVIDEFDASFHPYLTKSLIALFNNPQINVNNAQLIFATHDLNLLDQNIFNKSQIWFTEKDNYGSTELSSLLDFKDVRSRDNIERDYLKGKYGAIPNINDFNWN